jgi:hypothetical protein
VVQFGDPQSLSEATVASLSERWQPCSLPFIVDKGADAYAWLCPGELAGQLGSGRALSLSTNCPCNGCDRRALRSLRVQVHGCEWRNTARIWRSGERVNGPESASVHSPSLTLSTPRSLTTEIVARRIDKGGMPRE